MNERELLAVTRAVTDAVRTALPGMIEAALVPFTARIDATERRIASDLATSTRELVSRVDHYALIERVDRMAREHVEFTDVKVNSMSEQVQAMIAAALAPVASRIVECEGALTSAREATRTLDDRVTLTAREMLDAATMNLQSELKGVHGTVEQLLAGYDVRLHQIDERARSTLDDIAAADLRITRLGAECMGHTDSRIALEVKALNDALPITIAQELASHIDEHLKPVLMLLDDMTVTMKAQREGVAEVAADMAHLAAEVVAHADETITARIAALPPAERGPPGERGPQGEPGRDGVFTGPVVWKGGRHARGELVAHKLGLWVANADTDGEPGAPACGYTLLVDGVLPQRIESDEDGNLHLAFEHASGVRSVVPMGIRPMQWQGVYNNETAYLPPDIVTCEGSLWIARTPSRAVRPGTEAGAASWALIVKRGRDGRDGAPGPVGPIGEPGPAGPAGRDGKDAPAPLSRTLKKRDNGAAH